MIKIISKYIGIGILLGIGISITDYIYFQLVKDEKARLSNEIIEPMENFLNEFYVKGSESIFNNPKKYNPSMGLNFSLQGYELKGDKLLVSGSVSNVGVDQWLVLFVEIEVFNQDKEIIAECNDVLKDLKPGHWEAVIVECPILEKHVGRPINSLSFRIKKAYHKKRHLP